MSHPALASETYPGTQLDGERPAYETIVSVDLRDVVAFEGARFPEGAALLKALTDHPDHFFGSPISKLYGIEMLEDPGILPDSVRLVALAQSGNQYFFRKMQVMLDPVTRQPTNVSVLDDVPLQATNFSIRVGLLQRKAIVEDPAQGIRIIYPIGVGGFDEGVTHLADGSTRIMTPLFSHATINRRTTDPAKTWPDYYLGMPFMPITRGDGRLTDIAFHIRQHNELVRGFDSHGCMRMRDKDLKELFTLLFHGGTASMPVTVSLNLPATGADLDDHPYPLREDGYQTVVNCGSKNSPHSCHDPKHPDLTFMVDVRKAPPTDALNPYDGDALNMPELQELGQPGSQDPSVPQFILDEESGASKAG